jgi:hypothetical protein
MVDAMRKTVIAVVSTALLTGGLAMALAPAASASTTPVYYAPTWHAQVRPGDIIFGADGGIWARPRSPHAAVLHAADSAVPEARPQSDAHLQARR